MLEHLIGCRLESVRISRTSVALELAGDGDARRHFELSSSATLKSNVGEGPAHEVSVGELLRALEDVLLHVDFDATARTLTLRFQEGSVVTFEGNDEVSDHVAIWKDLSSDAWGILN